MACRSDPPFGRVLVGFFFSQSSGYVTLQHLSSCTTLPRLIYDDIILLPFSHAGEIIRRWSLLQGERERGIGARDTANKVIHPKWLINKGEKRKNYPPRLVKIVTLPPPFPRCSLFPFLISFPKSVLSLFNDPGGTALL